MKNFFRKLFGIYPGEGKKTFHFSCLVILWSLGATCISTLSDGLFIEEIGANVFLKAYFIAAITTIITSSLILCLLRHSNPYRILAGVLTIGSIAYAIGAIMLLYSPPVYFYFICKVFSLTFMVNLIACSWALIDHYHDIQDAKRTYALYNSSYFLGVILSGALITFLLKKLGNHFLFSIGSVSLLLAILQLKHIKKKDRPVHDETMEGVFTGDRKSVFYLIKQIFSHPFVFSLLSLSLVMQLINTTTEYSYLESFGKFFGNTNENKVTEFLANARAIISVFNIIVGIFLYGRFVRLVGLKNIVLLPAFAFLTLYGEWVAHDSLLIAIFGIICVDGIAYTIEDNNYNLMMNAVPSKLKAKTRIINDTFFEPIGMLISSLLLFSSNSKWLGLGLAVIMLIFSFIIRAIYHKAVFSNLKDNAVHFDRKAEEWFTFGTKKEQKELKHDLLKGLDNSSEEIKLLACEALLRLKEEKYFSAVLQAASKLSSDKKITFCTLLENSFFKNHSMVLPTLKTWLNQSKSKQLIEKIIVYFLKQGIHLDIPPVIATSFSTQDLLDSKNTHNILMGLEILEETGDEKCIEKTTYFFTHPSLSVQRKAIETYSWLSRKFSINPSNLMHYLQKTSDNYFRLKCLDALQPALDFSLIEKIFTTSIYFRPNERRKIEELIASNGKNSIPTLLSILTDYSIHPRIRILSGKALRKLSLSHLQSILDEIIYNEIKRAYFYFYYANALQNKNQIDDLSFLKVALQTGFHSVIDFIIHLLAASGSIEDCELLVRSLRSKNEKIHSHAIETLERSCHKKIFKWIAPLIDHYPWSEFINSYIRLIGKKPHLNLYTLLEELNHSPSLFDRVISEKLKSDLNFSNQNEYLEVSFETPVEAINQFAYGLSKI